MKKVFSESVILTLTLSLTLRVAFSKVFLNLLARFVVDLPSLKKHRRFNSHVTSFGSNLRMFCSVLHVEAILVIFL